MSLKSRISNLNSNLGEHVPRLGERHLQCLCEGFDSLFLHQNRFKIQELRI